MSYDIWLEYLEPEIMGNDDTLNSTCSQCNTPLTCRDAILVMGLVAIWLQCDNGHDTVEIVPVSRFIEVPLGKKESTLGNQNLPEWHF